jgi:Zn-finger nucleic acid-binding protein
VNCSDWTREITERSRRGGGPGDALAVHLAECPRCAAHWASQVELSRDMHRIRAAARHLRSPQAARDQLLTAFDERAAAFGSRPHWRWAAVAAMVVLLVAVGIWKQPAARHVASQLVQIDAGPDEMAADSGFVPVPYALPLAQGEVVEVVRMDLTPAALARLGFVTQAGYPNEVTADLAIGEDGLPRAVRLPESVEIRY